MAKINVWNFKNKKKEILDLYKNPDNLIVIEFANRTATKKFVWVEPTCVSIELDEETEYQMITHDRTFRMEFDKEETLIFYLQYSFGFILKKRPYSNEINNLNPWTIDLDCSEIN